MAATATTANNQHTTGAAAKGAVCRFCSAEIKTSLVDLGMSPLCESYLPAEKLNHMEPFYPLHVHVCDRCFLVQLEEYVTPDEGGDDSEQQKKLLAMIQKIWSKNKLDFRNTDVAEKLLSETEVAELWYLVEAEEVFSAAHCHLLLRV
jgi:hypothetical protein